MALPYRRPACGSEPRERDGSLGEAPLPLNFELKEGVAITSLSWEIKMGLTAYLSTKYLPQKTLLNFKMSFEQKKLFEGHEISS